MTRKKQLKGQRGDKTAFRHDHGQHWGSLTLSDQAPVNRADAEISSTGTDICPMGRAAVWLTSHAMGKKNQQHLSKPAKYELVKFINLN